MSLSTALASHYAIAVKLLRHCHDQIPTILNQADSAENVHKWGEEFADLIVSPSSSYHLRK